MIFNKLTSEQLLLFINLYMLFVVNSFFKEGEKLQQIIPSLFKKLFFKIGKK